MNITISVLYIKKVELLSHGECEFKTSVETAKLLFRLVLPDLNSYQQFVKVTSLHVFTTLGIVKFVVLICIAIDSCSWTFCVCWLFRCTFCDLLVKPTVHFAFGLHDFCHHTYELLYTPATNSLLNILLSQFMAFYEPKHLSMCA